MTSATITPFVAGPYRCVQRLGAGHLGTTYRAEHAEAGTVHVVKQLHEPVAADPALLEQILRVFDVGRSLDHPVIVSVSEVIKSEEGVCATSDWVDGADLCWLIGRLRENKTDLPQPVALQLVARLCDALDQAHHHRRDGRPDPLVHGSLWPANVLLAWNGDVFVRDFGSWCVPPELVADRADALLARQRLEHSSPEVARGEPPSPSSDVFCLAALLYELLTREPLFVAPTLETLAEEVRTARLGSFDRVPAAMRPLLRRCLALDPAERPGEAGALSSELAGAMRGQTAGGGSRLSRLLCDLAGRDPDEPSNLSASTTAKTQPKAPGPLQPLDSQTRVEAPRPRRKTLLGGIEKLPLPSAAGPPMAPLSAAAQEEKQQSDDGDGPTELRAPAALAPGGEHGLERVESEATEITGPPQMVTQPEPDVSKLASATEPKPDKPSIFGVATRPYQPATPKPLSRSTGDEPAAEAASSSPEPLPAPVIAPPLSSAATPAGKTGQLRLGSALSALPTDEGVLGIAARALEGAAVDDDDEAETDAFSADGQTEPTRPATPRAGGRAAGSGDEPLFDFSDSEVAEPEAWPRTPSPELPPLPGGGGSGRGPAEARLGSPPPRVRDRPPGVALAAAPDPAAGEGAPALEPSSSAQQPSELGFPPGPSGGAAGRSAPLAAPPATPNAPLMPPVPKLGPAPLPDRRKIGADRVSQLERRVTAAHALLAFSIVVFIAALVLLVYKLTRRPASPGSRPPTAAGATRSSGRKAAPDRPTARDNGRTPVARPSKKGTENTPPRPAKSEKGRGAESATRTQLKTRAKETRATSGGDASDDGASSGPAPRPVPPGTLEVLSDPQARVYLDGRPVGTTPLKLHLAAGKQALLSLIASGREIAQQRVKMGKKAGVRVSRRLSPASYPRLADPRRRGILRVRCGRRDHRRIFIAGKDTGYSCPRVGYYLAPGRYRVGFVSLRDGWRQRRWVRVRRGRITTLRVAGGPRAYRRRRGSR